jgi:hypothetical protein
MNLPAEAAEPDLELLRRAADPLADDTIGALLEPWGGEHEAAGAHQRNFAVLGAVSRQMEAWQTNGALANWRAGPGLSPQAGAVLEAYLQAGLALPAWADRERIERAEQLFIEFGMLSCTLLFCSSLPECYVVPDLAAVLHVAGQLEQRTEYRIRSTAAMIFPVMMVGGLTRPDGGGLAQVLKVRLIHATIRHLILRGAPARAGLADVLAPLAPAEAGNLHHQLYALGWNSAENGVPCSQDELAYTLLTFGYVFLRSLRKLGLGLSTDDELAYLHTWNVMGHVLGMQEVLMAHTMEQAEALFSHLQQRGRARPVVPDARPKLGRALMATMENVIPLGLIKPFPVLLTRHLCGTATAADIGIDHKVALLPRLLFAAFMLLIRGFDTCVRLVFKDFSISRMITRVVGYQFTCKVLMDQTRPLKLPQTLLNQMGAMTRHWHIDPKAPAWLNKVEHYLTGRKTAPGGKG